MAPASGLPSTNAAADASAQDRAEHHARPSGGAVDRLRRICQPAYARLPTLHHAAAALYED